MRSTLPSTWLLLAALCSLARAENAVPPAAPAAQPAAVDQPAEPAAPPAEQPQGVAKQAYRVDFVSTGDRALDSTLHGTSDLETLRTSAPVGTFGLIARARGDLDRLKTVLESFGYYQSSVSIKIDGQTVGAPGLVDQLAAQPKDHDARVEISFTLGPLYKLGRVTIDGDIPDFARSAFALYSGSPAVAADVLAAGARLYTALADQGYAFAKVDPPIAYEDQTEPVLDVVFHVDTGPRVNIGEINLEGLKRVHEKLVRRRLLLHTGELYSAAALERARTDLLALGVFGSITTTKAAAPDAEGNVAITFTFRERPRHAVALNAAYSSDLGGSAGVTWADRNLFGNAEQLTIAASLINAGGSATNGVGYNTSVKYVEPDFLRRNQSLQISVGAVKQYLEAYDQNAVTTAVGLTRVLSKQWTVGAGVSAADEQIKQEGLANDPTDIGVKEASDYVLVGIPLTVLYDSTGLSSPLDDPRRGMRDSLSVTPTRSFGQKSSNFIISQAKVAAYYDLEHLLGIEVGRSVIAARALAGLAQGASEFSLPPDQRFYGGGSGTIRGYRYQAVGPQFADGNPIGGSSIIAGSLEFRQRFGQNFGAAAFVDVGQVTSGLKPFGGECSSQVLVGSAVVSSNLGCGLYFGVGAGIRYYTAIGPIRLDLAVPTRRYSTDDDAFEIYIGLGQSF
jgi:translocation and assembly module TamA